ncbi:MAG: protein kinase, partial [Propionibacteriaceae bacterium]|nr:protein kinase [Propionibacteriaceae bacterium]
MTGALIGERYLLGDLLGKGGMADVNQAHDIRLKRQVAVKRINAERAGDANSRERFRLEAEAAARLNHPNIVAVYDAGEYQDQDSQKMVPYIVMELVKGKTIRQMIESGTKFTPTKVLEITATILEALDYSHEQGIVHRDIKPSNVMITHTGQVKVMDFGIARIDPDQAITQEATVLGTPQYFSPEQITGQVVDRRSDIYSTGCMLYELLTGQLPFDGGTATDIAIQHVRGIAVPPSEINPALSPAYDALCAKAMAKSLTERYQTAGAMRDDITRLLGGAVPPSPTSAEQPTVALTQADVTLPPSAAHRTTVLPTQTKVAPPVASQGAIPLRRLSPAPAKTLAPAPKERLSRSKWAFPTSATPNDRTRQIAAPSLTR